MPPPKAKPMKSPRKSPKKPSSKLAPLSFPPQFDENLRAAGLSPPSGVSPPALAALLASHVPVGDDPTFSALQELLLNNVSPPPQQPPVTGEDNISPSSQIMMLLEENGITGPAASKDDSAVGVAASPFDFSGAYYSGASSGGLPSACGAVMGPPPPMPPSAKAKAKIEAANWARGAAPASASQLEIPSQRRESEGEEKRLSAGTILDFYTEAVPDEGVNSSGKTPAPVPPPLQMGGEGSKAAGDGASPTVGQLSPLNPMHLSDVLTAF